MRVATAATTSISFADFTPAEGASYTLTVNGRQSGKSASASFPSASAPPTRRRTAATAAALSLRHRQGADRSSGQDRRAVLGLALMVLALGAGAMVVRSVKAGRR